jgi:hypothetical protein
VVDKSALEEAFRPSTSVFLCQYHSAFIPYWSSSTCCSYQKNKRAEPENLPKISAVFGNRGTLDKKVLSLLLFF